MKAMVLKQYYQPVSRTFPMQEANEALLELSNEGTAGRIVLTIREPLT